MTPALADGPVKVGQKWPVSPPRAAAVQRDGFPEAPCLPLADQHHVGIAPVSEHTGQDPPEGEEETRENYCAASQNLQHPARSLPPPHGRLHTALRPPRFSPLHMQPSGIFLSEAAAR